MLLILASRLRVWTVFFLALISPWMLKYFSCKSRGRIVLFCFTIWEPEVQLHSEIHSVFGMTHTQQLTSVERARDQTKQICWMECSHSGFCLDESRQTTAVKTPSCHLLRLANSLHNSPLSLLEYKRKYISTGTNNPTTASCTFETRWCSDDRCCFWQTCWQHMREVMRLKFLSRYFLTEMLHVCPPPVTH